MNKIFKITGWVLALVGIILAIVCLTTGNGVDILLRFTYALLIAALVIWIGLAIIITGKNNPKGLIKAGILLVAAAAFILVVYFIASGAPALNVKSQPSQQWLKLTDTMLLLTYILGGGAVAAIVFGAITNAVKK